MSNYNDGRICSECSFKFFSEHQFEAHKLGYCFKMLQQLQEPSMSRLAVESAEYASKQLATAAKMKEEEDLHQPRQMDESLQRERLIRSIEKKDQERRTLQSLTTGSNYSSASLSFAPQNKMILMGTTNPLQTSSCTTSNPLTLIFTDQSQRLITQALATNQESAPQSLTRSPPLLHLGQPYSNMNFGISQPQQKQRHIEKQSIQCELDLLQAKLAELTETAINASQQLASVKYQVDQLPSVVLRSYRNSASQIKKKRKTAINATTDSSNFVRSDTATTNTATISSSVESFSPQSKAQRRPSSHFDDGRFGSLGSDAQLTTTQQQRDSEINGNTSENNNHSSCRSGIITTINEPLPAYDDEDVNSRDDAQMTDQSQHQLKQQQHQLEMIEEENEEVVSQGHDQMTATEMLFNYQLLQMQENFSDNDEQTGAQPTVSTGRAATAAAVQVEEDPDVARGRLMVQTMPWYRCLAASTFGVARALGAAPSSSDGDLVSTSSLRKDPSNSVAAVANGMTMMRPSSSAGGDAMTLVDLADVLYCLFRQAKQRDATLINLMIKEYRTNVGFRDFCSDPSSGNFDAANDKIILLALDNLSGKRVKLEFFIGKENKLADFIDSAQKRHAELLTYLKYYNSCFVAMVPVEADDSTVDHSQQ